MWIRGDEVMGKIIGLTCEVITEGKGSSMHGVRCGKERDREVVTGSGCDSI
jgi:hypothetical protein